MTTVSDGDGCGTGGSPGLGEVHRELEGPLLAGTPAGLRGLVSSGGAMLLLVALLALGGCAGLEGLAEGEFASRASVSVPEGEAEIVFLDVGQGTAAVVRSGDEAVLVDGGPTVAGPGVVEDLGRLGIAALQAVVLSHADEDHVGGLLEVLERVPVERVYDSAYPHTTEVYADFLGAVEQSGAEYHETRAGDAVELAAEDLSLEFIYPDELGAGPNESSLVLDLTFGEFDALLMGDAEIPEEEELLAAGRLYPVELLQVGHHGSSGATGESFLSAVAPEVGIIQVGEENTYGHPTAEVLDRLALYEVEVYRTDQDGEVAVETDGEGYEVTAAAGDNAAGEATDDRAEPNAGAPGGASGPGAPEPSSGPAVPEEPPAGGNCPDETPVKGNESSSGELIYHEPDGAYYEATSPVACFASAGEAEAAGYRASQR